MVLVFFRCPQVRIRANNLRVSVFRAHGGQLPHVFGFVPANTPHDMASQSRQPGQMCIIIISLAFDGSTAQSSRYAASSLAEQTTPRVLAFNVAWRSWGRAHRALESMAKTC